MTPVGWGGLVASNAAAQSNSLIAAPAAPGWMDGVGPFQDGMTVGQSLQSGDWVGGILAGGSIVLDVANAIANPIATLVSLGVGWVLEHIWPLSDWLNQLTGDHRMVTSYAQTWQNISASVAASGQELQGTLSGLVGMSGAAIDIYRALLQTMAGSLGVASTLASGVGVAVELVSTIVKAVHDLVRDAISDLVGYVVQSLAEIAATLGAATPVVAAQVAIKSADWAAMLAKFVKELVRSVGLYVDLANALKGVFDGVTQTLDGKLGTA